MRVVTFVERLEFEFVGNIVENAVCLGDIDNDGLNELVAGNDKGDLMIFKCVNERPIFTYKCGSMITAVAVGDVCNIGRNALIAITSIGNLFIFDFHEMKLAEKRLIPPVHTQQLPANIKMALIGDVNGDGCVELLVSMTDRVVRAYSWFSTGDLVGGKPYGKLVGLNKWELADQIGNISFNKAADGSTCLLVSQPGGTHFTLKYNHTTGSGDSDCLKESSFNNVHKRLRNQNIHTIVCGDVSLKKGENEPSPYAMATLDGTLMLIQKDDIKWNIQLDHQLFSLANLDLTGDGIEELVACAWDGNTYIVKPNDTDQSTNCIRYTFPESVSAFTAGKYGHKGQHLPSFVYIAVSGRIYLYYNLQLPTTSSQDQPIEEDEDFIKFLLKQGIDPKDKKAVRDIKSKLLYDYDSFFKKSDAE